MEGFTKAQMWSSVMRLAKISHSVMSNNQRLVYKSFQTAQSVGLDNLEPQREIQVRATIEDMSGKIFQASA